MQDGVDVRSGVDLSLGVMRGAGVECADGLREAPWERMAGGVVILTYSWPELDPTGAEGYARAERSER